MHKFRIVTAALAVALATAGIAHAGTGDTEHANELRASLDATTSLAGAIKATETAKGGHAVWRPTRSTTRPTGALFRYRFRGGRPAR